MWKLDCYTNNRVQILLIASWILFRIRAVGSHFLVYEIPLGYDPWLYKVMFEEMSQLRYWNRSELSWWIQSMFPPFLGMVWALMMEFGRTSQWLITRWAVGFSRLVIISLTVVARRLYGNLGASWVFFVACSSFVLYQLFWWWYLKQIVWVYCIIITLYILCLKKTIPQYILVWLFLAVGWLTQRPALVLWGLLGVIWLVMSIKRDKNSMLWVWVAGIVLCSIWRFFWDIQILPMIEPFFNAINIPNYTDEYKSWWTFLTMAQRISTDGIVLLMSIVWWWFMIYKKSWSTPHKRIGIVWVLLIVWVGVQLIFYQRMIWYLSPVLILWSGYGIVAIQTKYRKWILIFWVILQSIVSLWTVYHTRPPIINPLEYAMIQQIPELVEQDAIIIVSWIWYSPWVRWWSWREVIAPWLFDYTQWGTQAEWWSTQWIDVDWDTKCNNVRNVFWYLNRPMYAWVGLLQEEETMDGYCMTKVLEHSKYQTALYRLEYEN